MKKYLMLASSNIRKRKKQTIVIVFLIIAAACMMNIWLFLAGDYKANFDNQHERLHSEHVSLAFNSNDSEVKAFIAETLKQDDRVSEFIMDDALLTAGSFDYNSGSISMNILFMEEKTAFHRSIGKTEVIEANKDISGVYLPLLYTSDENLKIGKQLPITIGDSQFVFPIAGYSNNIMMGSSNCVMMTLVLPSELYQELSENPLLPKSTLVSIRTTDKSYGEAVETKLSESLAKKYPKLQFVSNSYQLIASSRYISQMICAAILSAMAFIVLLIVIIVMVANVITDIQENMTKLGILKAIGYQNKQIIYAYMLQALLIAFISSIFGAMLSYCLFPAINDLMIAQTGIPYSVHFLPLPLLFTVSFITLIMLVAVYYSAHKIKHFDAICALRQGIHTHNFQKNYFPLERTKMSFIPALALKTATSQVKQNIIVCITTLVLTLVTAFSAVMLENVIFDDQPLIDMVVGESADSVIGIDAEKEQELRAFLKQHPQVEKSYLYSSGIFRHVNKASLVVTITDDFHDLNNQMICIEGRFPQYENEVAIAAKYAKEQGIEIGDEITLSADGKEAVYIVSGYSQLSNNLGKDCFLTRQGYERMGKLSQVSYYLNLIEGSDIDAFHEEVSNTFHEHIKALVNIESVITATSEVYVTMMSFIVVIILLLSILIVGLVLYLLVRTLLNHKRYDYGIMKALGFTTRQLVIQTALSFMPMVIASCVIGLLVNSFAINPLAALFLSNIGIVKSMFEIPWGLIFGLGFVLVLFTFVIVCFLSLRIKRITPIALLSGE